MDEFKLTQELDRGARAKEILENELYREAWTSVEQALIQKWRDCPVRDKEGQHELKLMLKLLDDAKAHLERVMASGKLAESRLQELKRRFTRKA